MNNKNLLIPCVLFASLSVVYFLAGQKTTVIKPEMSEQFSTILTINSNAYKQASTIDKAALVITKSLPKSLIGIDLEIALPLDADGNLIVGMELKDFFEIYLSAMGEEELEDILLRIQSALAQQLSSPALEQGYETLKRFIDYKVELANLEQQTPDASLTEIENIRLQKEILAAIQQEYFSPNESEALFSAEADYDQFMLEHLTIQQNTDLSAEQKQQQVSALEATLPEDIRASRNNAMAPAKVYEQAQVMKTEGQSAEAIYQMRAQSLGEEAAQELAALDQSRDAWQQRVNSFKEAYTTLQDSSLSEQDRQIEIESILARDFSDNERVRVLAVSGLL